MIVFNQVSKVFADGTVGLQDVSLQIKPGEAVIITGPSGAGKTTLMRLLTKEYEPSQGEILFQEQPLSRIKPGRVFQHRRQIGVIFQDYKLLPDLNVWENIALALDILHLPQTEIEERITDLLELVELVDKAYLFPSQLSGGEAQRVSIARALAPAPKVVFADEPTGNLDPITSKTIAQLLGKINELGTTLLLATHDQGVLESLPRRTLVLERGKIVKDSQPSPTKSNKSDKPTPASKPASSAKKIVIQTATENLDSPDSTSSSKSLDSSDSTPQPTQSAPPTKSIKPTESIKPAKPVNRIQAWLSKFKPAAKEPKS